MNDEEKEAGYFRVTDRSLVDYKTIFNLRIEDFKPNSRVLDAGSGIHQTFAREIQQQRPDIRVVSLDPTLFLKKYDIETKQATDAEREKRRKEKYGEVVAAIFPKTPFKDKSFNYIFDNHGPFMYFEDQFTGLKSYISELLRLLKPDGSVFIYPLDLLADLLAGDVLSADKEQIYLKSENRILTIMGELGREVHLEYHLFDFTEGTIENPLIRKGIKITKKS